MGTSSSEPERRWTERQAARRLLFSSLKRRKRHFVASMIGAVFYMGAQAAIPLVGMHAVDDVIGGRNVGVLPLYIGIVLGLGVVRGLFGGLRKYQAAKLMAAAGNDVREWLYSHLQRLSFSFHDRLGAGQLMSRASSDVTMLEGAFAFLPFVLQSAILFAVSVVMLFTLQTMLAGVVVAVVALVSVLTLRYARPIYGESRIFQDRMGAFAQFVEQRINGIRVVKGHGLEDVHRAQGHHLSGQIHESGIRLTRIRARFNAAMMVVPGSAMLVVLGLGGWLGVQGQMTTGSLFAFLQYLGMLVVPIVTASQVMSIWPMSMASAARVAEVLAADPDVAEPAQARPLEPGPGSIRFENVWFGYEPDAPVLRGFNLDIPGGTSVAFVGPSGSGKSTIAQLVPRFYDPWSGRVLVDGVDVSTVSLSQLREAISVVFEDTVMFTASIRENIALGTPSGYPEIRRAAELAHADDFIKELPDGYDTIVGEQGMSLSGGQRQRVAIARAILRGPRILILDDAMSAVDPVSDEAIRLGLAEVMRGRTTVIVAHRVETLALADRVVLLGDGEVVAVGRHDDLLGLPAYRQALAIDEYVVRSA